MPVIQQYVIATYKRLAQQELLFAKQLQGQIGTADDEFWSDAIAGQVRSAPLTPSCAFFYMPLLCTTDTVSFRCLCVMRVGVLLALWIPGLLSYLA